MLAFLSLSHSISFVFLSPSVTFRCQQLQHVLGGVESAPARLRPARLHHASLASRPVLLVPAARRLVESERAQERADLVAARHAQRRATEFQGLLCACVCLELVRLWKWVCSLFHPQAHPFFIFMRGMSLSAGHGLRADKRRGAEHALALIGSVIVLVDLGCRDGGNATRKALFGRRGAPGESVGGRERGGQSAAGRAVSRRAEWWRRWKGRKIRQQYHVSTLPG